MTALVHDLGIDLPLLESLPQNPELGMHRTFQVSQDGSATRFIRRIDIKSDARELALDELLDIADSEFATVAERCGATVLNHTWGFVRLPEGKATSRYVSMRSYMVNDLVLAAEVELVQIERSSASWEAHKVAEHACETYRTNVAPGAWYWSDSHSGQFLYGSCGAATQPRLYLSDLDLMFKIKR